jgi:hypothetical protein
MMPSEKEWDRIQRVAECELIISRMMADLTERDVSIWIAAFAGRLQRLAQTSMKDEEDE